MVSSCQEAAPQANPNAVHGEICLRPKWSPSLIEVRLMHAELALIHGPYIQTMIQTVIQTVVKTVQTIQTVEGGN